VEFGLRLSVAGQQVLETFSSRQIAVKSPQQCAVN